MDHAWRAEIIQNRHGSAGAFGIIRRDSSIERLARAHDLIQCAHGFLKWGFGVEPVRIENVDILKPHAFK